MPEPRRPLGLFLSGGGSHGAWQAAALELLLHAAGGFDKVMGFSIGAINGVALAHGRFAEALARWRALDGGVLELRPRLRPFSLVSDRAVRRLLDVVHGAELKVPLCLVGACDELGCAEYAEFRPGDARRGELEPWVLATSAIPGVFPPVRIGGRSYIDGGVPMPAPMRFDFLADCAEVWIVEVARAEELHPRPSWNPFRALDRRARRSVRRVVDEGAASLASRPAAPVVRRLAPSRPLAPTMLDFSARSVRPLLELGARDARAFLEARG